MSQPKIFVSSTCFDLSQIRSDLSDFISSIGYLPILSEYSSFPIDPNSDTLENCRHNVENADIFLLILGNRYGFQMDSGKSVTNMEYMYAQSLGIPVYIFIYRPLIPLLNVWKDNKDANFSQTVDSPKVFEFVEDVREKNGHWCFEFDRAQDIIQTLRIQLSHLFKSSLDLRLKYRIDEAPSFYKQLSAKALKLIMDKPEAWEVRYFLQVFEDELDKHYDLRLDYEYQVLTHCHTSITNNSDLAEWLQVNFEGIHFQINSFNQLFHEAYQKFYGEPGVPSDLKGLYYVARSIARIYSEMAKWAINIRSTYVKNEYEYIRKILARIPEEAMQAIWIYPRESTNKIKEALDNYQLNKQQTTIEATLVLTIEKGLIDTFNKELNKIQQSII